MANICKLINWNLAFHKNVCWKHRIHQIKSWKAQWMTYAAEETEPHSGNTERFYLRCSFCQEHPLHPKSLLDHSCLSYHNTRENVLSNTAHALHPHSKPKATTLAVLSSFKSWLTSPVSSHNHQEGRRRVWLSSGLLGSNGLPGTQQTPPTQCE